MSGDLPAGGERDGRDDGERDLALAVRRAVLDDDAWTPERLSALVERADRRATGRRRRRQVAAPVAALAAAAAVALGLVVVPPLVEADRPVEAAAPGPWVAGPEGVLDPAATAAAEREGRLSAADVHTVVPGAWAVPNATGSASSAAAGTLPLPDACGTGGLGVEPPVTRSTARWQVPTGGEEVFAEESASPSLVSRIDTYADAAQATAAADALDASTSTCTPRPGVSQPSNPIVFQVYITNAIYGSTTDGDPGVYRVTAAAASGAHVATVSAVVDGTDGADQDITEQVVAGDVASLAKAAAARADGQEDVAERELRPHTPVTTAEVDVLLPGAYPQIAYQVQVSQAQQPFDACGTAPLAGVETPGVVTRGAWGDPTFGRVDFGMGDGAPTAMGLAAVVVTASDLGTPAAAQTYAAAFRASASSCTPTPGTLPLAPVDLLPEGSADALFTTAYAEASSRYWYTAVVVRGSAAGTVSAYVSGGPSRDVATQVARGVVDLATAAATRTADRATGSQRDGDAP